MNTSSSLSASTTRTDRGFSVLLHFAEKWSIRWHWWHRLPKAGQVSFSRRSWRLPHLLQLAEATSRFESTGLRLLLLLYTFITCTAVSLSDIVFIWDVMISAARQISSVLSIVSPVSRNKRSLTLLSHMPKMSLSRRMSFGVIVSKSQVSASLSSDVLYCSYCSPDSCTRLLNL